METSGTVDDVGWSSVVQNKKGKGKKKKKMQNARTLSLQVPCSSHVFSAKKIVACIFRTFFREKNRRMYFPHFFPRKNRPLIRIASPVVSSKFRSYF
jgi:hypothetical protein